MGTRDTRQEQRANTYAMIGPHGPRGGKPQQIGNESFSMPDLFTTVKAFIPQVRMAGGDDYWYAADPTSGKMVGILLLRNGRVVSGPSMQRVYKLYKQWVK